MKKLLLIPLLLLLTSCVTYYYPETAIEDGVYYAEDDPAYNNNAYSYTYGGTAYYPWWSMDYFYLGYGPYSGYGFGYGGYIGGGFSIGISYGYSPWYYPYYGYYSPWYRPHRPHYYQAYRGYCSHHNACGHKKKKNRRDRDHDRYVGNDHTNRRNRDGGNGDGQEDPGNRRGGSNGAGSYSTSPMRRYVSTTPSGYSGNRGMVVRNRETAKPGKSRTEPVRSRPVETTGISGPSNQAAEPEIRSLRGNKVVRYRSGSKQGRSRTGPVEPSGPAQVTSSPTIPRSGAGNRTGKRATEPTIVYRSRQGSGEVRYRSGTKQGRPKTTPVDSGNRVPVAGTAPRTVVIPKNSPGKGRSAKIQGNGNLSRGPSSMASAPRTKSRNSGSGAYRSRSSSPPPRSGGGSAENGRSGNRKNRN